MATVDLLTTSGTTSGSVELDDALFGVEPNGPVMHQVVVAQLAAARKGTASTKTRAEVRGGGRKPWRQKGTGNARQGSIRAPHWRGGGVAHGPKPRSYAQRTPKKMKRLALASALSDRLADDHLLVIDGWGFDRPSTKDAVAALGSLGVDGTVLVVLAGDDENAARSFRNLPDITVARAGSVTTYDVLVNDWIVYTQASLPGAESDEAGEPEAAAEAAPEKAPAKQKAPAPKAAPKIDEAEASSTDEPAEAQADDESSDEDAAAEAPAQDSADATDPEATESATSAEASAAEADTSDADAEADAAADEGENA